MISWIRSALAPAMLPVALSAGMLVTACGPGSGAAKDSAAAIQAEAGSAAAIHTLYRVPAGKPWMVICSS